jgi:energy-converting hydrogenase Eha subunit C
MLSYDKQHVSSLQHKVSLSLYKTATNQIIVNLLRNNWSHFLLPNPLKMSKYLPLVHSFSKKTNFSKKNPFYNNFLTQDFKSIGNKTVLDYNSPNGLTSKPFTKLPTKLQKPLIHLFRVFVRVNMSSQSELTAPHHSFRTFYLSNMAGGLTIISIPKLFQKWKSSYFLLFNLYYHGVDMLTFSPAFFKREVLSLNWAFHKNFQFMWRYTRPFLVFKPNKITNHGDFVFRKLRALGLSVGIVTDVLYHNKTIYYLKRTGFYSIGLVPTIYNAYTVDFAIPTAYDSIFTQIFFVRFLIRVKQDASTAYFTQLQNMWVTEPYTNISNYSLPTELDYDAGSQSE